MAGRTVDVMAAAGGALFSRDQLAVAAAGGALFGRDQLAYCYGSSIHGAAAVPFHHRFVQSGGAGGAGGGGVVAHEAGVVAAGGAVASFASADGYGGAAHGAVTQTALQHPPAVAADDGVAAAPFKGAWTKEEDEILRQMVGVHGDRKWAAIARDLPGRIGKQCRERWINHLHPGIKKDGWTEEEDMALIRAHRSSGNRWSVIARHLPGRSENSVKNHWNATKRSLAAKRRLRKRNSDAPPPAPGQLSLLAEYIRSLCPGVDDSEAPPPTPVTSSAPPSDDYVHMQVQAYDNPRPDRSTAAGIYLSQAPAMAGQLGQYGGGGIPEGRYSYYLPSYAHMNLHYGPLQMLGGVAAQAADHFHAAPAYAVVDGAMHSYLQHHHHQFAGEQINLASNVGQEIDFDDRESSTNNQGTGAYYGEPAAAAGPSSGADGNYPEVVQMASREFAVRDQDGHLTVDLTRFR